MVHPTFRIMTYRVTGPYSLHVEFDDSTAQDVNLEAVLEGEIFGPLKDPDLFASVDLDPETHTLVWPNGADFDPETLHNWPKFERSMREMARRWAASRTRA